MNLIFLIGFGYFCFNQVILTSTGKIENGNIPEEIFKSIEFSLEHTEHKTQLMDLDSDCLFLVLNQLDLNSLFSVAEAHSGFTSLVSGILKKIFQNKEICIVPMSSPDTKISHRIGIDRNYIYTTSVSIAKRLLKNFGHLIQKIQIRRNYARSDDSHRSIYKLVNVHCSKTLKEIWLDNSQNYFLNEFTNQFENVQNVFIRDSLETDRRLNEIFPLVRRLHFLTFKISNTDSITVKYANLEHLEISIDVYRGSIALSEEMAAELIRKNPHIRSLSLKHASVELIKIAADSLPQLERLKLDYIRSKYNNESIAFPNVRIFETLKSFLNDLFLNLKFGNIEEIHTDGLADSMYGENGFFANNKNLKKLKLIPQSDSIVYLTTDEFKKLANANSTLQDIFIDTAYGFGSSSILQLIEKSKQLERLQINHFSPKARNSISKHLHRTISSWSMDELGLYAFILKKEK